MPHSFSVLNLATCESIRLASAPNHGCQSFTLIPRNASFSTCRLLTAGTGVFASAFATSVAFGGGVRVLVSEGREDVQAEKINGSEKSVIQTLRKKGISRLPWG